MATKIQVRRDTTTNWSSVNPILSIGEIGLDTDLKKLKIGDGTTSWSSLSFLSSGFSDPMTTRGDIIVRDSSNTTARLPIGTSGQVLQSNGTDIVWTTPASSGVYITTTNPTVSSYPTATTKDMWFNSTTQILYILVDPTADANVWREVVGGSLYVDATDPFGDNSQKLLYEFNSNVLDMDYKAGGDTTYNGTATNITYGNDGDSYAVFDGVSSKITFTPLTFTGEFTLVAYLYKDVDANGEVIGEGATGDNITILSNTAVAININGASVANFAISTPSTTKFKLIVWRDSSNIIHVSVNDVNSATTPTANTNAFTFSNIGSRGSTTYWDGRMYRIQIFNRALTQAERESL